MHYGHRNAFHQAKFLFGSCDCYLRFLFFFHSETKSTYIAKFDRLRIIRKVIQFDHVSTTK
jgi:hypothetical protein